MLKPHTDSESSDMRKRNRNLLGAALVLAGAHAFAPAAGAQTRGELLYTTHCQTCHTAQMHWRDKKLAKDWDSLQAWVRFWQGNAQLGWSEEDIAQVARHLNAAYYRFPVPAIQARDTGAAAKWARAAPR
jgi:cytochrome c553